MSMELGTARLNRLIEALGALDEARFELMLGVLRGELEPPRGRSRAAAPEPGGLLPAPPVDLARLPAQLNEAPSRDAAHALLRQLRTKAEVVSLAKLTGQSTKGNRTELEDRIVNATAGIRLDSAAIHRR